MSIENIQDFYQTWCSEVSKNENEFSLLVNNPGDMAMALLRLQNDLCEQA